MSLADEMLNNISDGDMQIQTAEPETEGHIVIDNNRNVIVPKELTRIAVQFDHNIETVTFDCPRYWDGNDMSVATIYINYMRPDGEKGSYIATNIIVDQIDESIMHFNWIINKHATMINGNLKFLVCIKKVDSEGNEEQHWNSKLCSQMTISKGLECTDTFDEDYPDLYSQLVNLLNTKVDEVEGKGLSTNDYTTAEKEKLSGIASGANKTVVDSELSDTSTNPIQNKAVNTAVKGLTDRITAAESVSAGLSNSVQSLFDGKADKEHTHTQSDITGLETTLNNKSDKTHTHKYAGSSSAGGAATTAINDNKGQEIDSTYIKNLSVSGKVITYTKGDDTTGTITTQDTNTTYGVATTSANGLMSASDKTKLNNIATGANAYTHPTTSGNKHIPSGGSSGQILRWSADGTAAWGADNNTTYSNFIKSGSGAKSGLVPAPSTTAGTTKYLREDGTWQVPPNTTYSSLKNPYALTIKGNGTTLTNGIYDGSAAKTVNITPSIIGAAASSHGTHVNFGTTVPKGNGTAAVGTATTVSRSDHVHPLQTTVSGNAGSATKLQTARTINGVSFDGTANITVPRSINHIHAATGISGTAGYIKICTIKTVRKYANQPVKLTVSQRNISHYDIVFMFKSAETTNADVYQAYYVSYRKGMTPYVYYVKTDTGTFDIYIKKVEAYDNIFVLDYLKADANSGDNYTLTFSDTQVSTLPTGYVQFQNTLGTMAAKNANDYLPLSGGALNPDAFLEATNASDNRLTRYGASVTFYTPTGEYSSGMYLKKNDGTILGRVGFYGNADNLHYTYVGEDYSDPLLKVEPNGNVTAKGALKTASSGKLLISTTSDSGSISGTISGLSNYAAFLVNLTVKANSGNAIAYYQLILPIQYVVSSGYYPSVILTFSDGTVKSANIACTISGNALTLKQQVPGSGSITKMEVYNLI